MNDTDIHAFIARWGGGVSHGGNERANLQLFLTEFCTLLDLPQPDPASADNRQNAYVFERSVTERKADGSTTPRALDRYRRGCFVLEGKNSCHPRIAGLPATRGRALSADRLDAAKSTFRSAATGSPIAHGSRHARPSGGGKLGTRVDLSIVSRPPGSTDWSHECTDTTQGTQPRTFWNSRYLPGCSPKPQAPARPLARLGSVETRRRDYGAAI